VGLGVGQRDCQEHTDRGRRQYDYRPKRAGAPTPKKLHQTSHATSSPWILIFAAVRAAKATLARFTSTAERITLLLSFSPLDENLQARDLAG
jgi:hypothetical protein